MRQQRGFTLIELIIVIVILGILAVTAAPRFIDIQSDARVGTLNGVKGALQSASQLVFAKAAIAGVQDDPSATVRINGNATTGTSVATKHGYPDVTSVTTIADLGTFVDFDGGDLIVFGETTPADTDTIQIGFVGETEADNCYVQYTNATAPDTLPSITIVGDC